MSVDRICPVFLVVVFETLRGISAYLQKNWLNSLSEIIGAAHAQTAARTHEGFNELEPVRLKLSLNEKGAGNDSIDWSALVRHNHYLHNLEHELNASSNRFRFWN